MSFFSGGVKFASMGLVAAALLASGPVAQAVPVGFSFENQDGAINGTVTGIFDIPAGDGVFAASNVTVTSGPAGMGFTHPTVFGAGFVGNSVTVSGGVITNIDLAALFNGATALSLKASVAGGSTFLDVLNGANFGATGVRDADSSTLVFNLTSVPTAVPEPASSMMLAGGVFAVATVRRRHRA